MSERLTDGIWVSHNKLCCRLQEIFAPEKNKTKSQTQHTERIAADEGYQAAKAEKGYEGCMYIF